MPVIIDGHNLLWAIPKTSGESGALSEIQLCRILGEYLKKSNSSGEIIFDGVGPPDKSGFDNISNLEVFFSGLGSDADTLIEDRIEVSSAPRQLIVVSSDRRLQKAARIRKAVSVKSEVFWKGLLRRLEKKKQLNEPAGKRKGLTDSETEQWLKFFGFEQ